MWWLLLLIFSFILIGFWINVLKNKKDFKDEDTSTKTSYEIGERYEDKVYKILNEIASDIEVEHVPKGVKGVDFIVVFRMDNGDVSKLLIEAKDVQSYSIDWERKLNTYMIDNKFSGKAIIVSTVKKNNRPNDNGYWVSDVNEKIIIMDDSLLTNYIREEFARVVDDNKKKTSLSIKEQSLLEEKEKAQTIDRGFKSLLNEIKEGYKSFITKFTTKIDNNLNKIKNIKLSNDSKFKNVDIKKVENLTNQIKDLTNEVIEELEKEN